MMKGLRRAALVVAVATLPLAANAQIKALDDTQMGNMTGQAGITIELQTKVDIGQIKYTDEGSLAINNVSIGGANKTSFFPEFTVPDFAGSTPSDLLDNIKLNIDIANNGDAVINMLPVHFQAVDFKVSTGAWNLEGSGGTTTILDNFNMVGLLGGGTIHVFNATHKVGVRLAFAIDDMNFDLPTLAVGLRNVRVTGENYDPIIPNVLDLFSDNTFYLYRENSALSGHDSLALDMPSFKADMTIGGLIVGGASVGSLKFDNLELSNTHLNIYGH
jgi:hypothetical protein